MPSRVDLLKNNGVAVFRHIDAFNENDLYALRCGCAFALSLNGWQKALINLRKAHIETSASEFAYHFRSLDNHLPNGAIVAIVEPVECNFDYCRLAKSIMNAWTTSKAEIFQNEKDALRWLNSHTKNKTPSRSSVTGAEGGTRRTETAAVGNPR